MILFILKTGSAPLPWLFRGILQALAGGWGGQARPLESTVAHLLGSLSQFPIIYGKKKSGIYH